MYESRWAIFSCIWIALALALIYLKFLDWFANVMAYLTIIVIEVSLCVLGYFAYDYAHQIQATQGGNSQSSGLLWTAAICWILAGLYYVIMACNFKSLRISIAIIDTAADWFTDTKRIVLVPLMYFCIWVSLFIFWLWGLVGVLSISDDNNITVSSVQFQTKDVNRSSGTNWMVAGMVFGMVWIIAFITAANEFAVIVATCTWYFSRKDIPDNDGIPGDSDVTKGLTWTYRYQMGTLALGSFLLTVIWMVRSILEYLGDKLHEATGGNACLDCMLCCMRCILDCFDRFIRYLNVNAYIYNAITCESFCPSALHAFLLILKNHSKFAFVEGIAGAFMFLAKTFIAVLTTLIGYAIIPPITAPVEVNPVAPCFFIFLFSYIVAATFISIFETSSNSILQCYLFDQEIARHHNLDLKHVPAKLVKFLALHDETVKTGDAATPMI